MAAAGTLAWLLIIQEPIYDKHWSLPLYDKAYGSTEAHYPKKKKKSRALWATRAKLSAHTQADIVRLFAQPRGAPRGFPAKETFPSRGGGCRRLLIQHGFGLPAARAGGVAPSAGRPRNCIRGGAEDNARHSQHSIQPLFSFPFLRTAVQGA